MKIVYKYKLEIIGSDNIEMLKGAQILCVKNQTGNELSLWVLVNDDVEEFEERKFISIGTGHLIPETIKVKKYIGTVLTMRNTFVTHVFEIV